MPVSNSFDVYQEFIQRDPNGLWVSAMCAFAVVEGQRFEWMLHYEDQHGIAPSDEEIKRWYRELPDIALINAKEKADREVTVYTEEVEKNMLQHVLVNEVKSLKKRWYHFPLSVWASFLGTFLFSISLVLFIIFVKSDTSPEALRSLFVNEVKEQKHGQETNK